MDFICFRSKVDIFAKSSPSALEFIFKLGCQFRDEFWLGDSALALDVFVNFGLRNT